MRVLLTGAQGYLGHHISKIFERKRGFHLIATGRVSSKDVVPCDLSSKKDVAQLIKAAEPDCILHCAAHVPKTPEEYDRKKVFSVNIEMLRNIMECSECPLFFVSSMTVYGDSCGKVVKESHRKSPSSEYAKSKLACEDLFEKSGRAGFTIRLPGLFGLPRRGGIVFNLLHALKHGYSVNLPENPLVWAAMDVHDAATSIGCLLEAGSPQGYQELNIGYRGEQSINILLQHAVELSGRVLLDYPVKHPAFEYDLKNAERYGIVPSISFFNALKRLYALL